MVLPFLDIADPGFSTRSNTVKEAREKSWCAETPYGLAVLRHRDAGQLLRDRRLRQGSHAWPDIVGLKGRFAEFWKASLISLEGADHKAARRVAQQALAEDFVLSLAPQFHTIACEIADDLRNHKSFDFVDAFSEPFAGRAIAVLLGLPVAESPALARDAASLGLVMGVEAKRHEATANAACTRLSQLAGALIERAEDGRDRTSFVARLLTANRDNGGLDRQSLIDLIVISIFGGVDTTRAQLAFAVHLFAEHADQWKLLRRKPDRIPAAIEEVIRARPTTTWATREALDTFEHGGVTIPKGATLHIFVHATATDPAAEQTDCFDIRTPRKAHFGFGGGAHHCLGQFVARTDMAAALRALLTRWSGVSVVGTPEFLPDSGNTSPAQLIVRPDWV